MSKPFPPVYVLTVRECPQRRVATQKHFNELGISANWVEGINGMTMGMQATVPHDCQPDGTFKIIHPLVLAIALGHWLAVKIALSHSSDEFFVMEDDVSLCPDFVGSWNTIRGLVPDNIGVIQCSAACWEDKDKSPINGHIEHRYYPFSAACTWWRREAAQFMVNNLFPLNSPVDLILAERIFPFVGHAITRERIASHRSGKEWPSTFGPNIENPENRA